MQTELLVEDGGLRLDAYLAVALDVSRSKAAKLVDDGCVLVDGRKRKAAFKVEAGMQIVASVAEDQTAAGPQPRAMDLPIIFEDRDIVVINKPAGLVVHPGAGGEGDTMVNGLLARYPEIAAVGDPERPGIVHRLDKLTSGVMVVARSCEAYTELAAAFKRHGQQREYECICYGHLPQAEGRIETLIGRHPKDRKRMSTRVSDGREAITHWKVLSEWPGLSRLRLQLQTGRTHQIRVHLADMNHPVVGDPVYGGRKRVKEIMDPALRGYIRRIERQMLHATLLGFKHPVGGEYLEFKAPLPADMLELQSRLDKG